MFGLFVRSVEQRGHARHDCQIRATAQFAGGQRIPGKIVDISQGGCLFRADKAIALLPAPAVTLWLDGSSLAATILSRSRRGMHCRFPAALSRLELRALLSRFAARPDRVELDHATEAASGMLGLARQARLFKSSVRR